MRDDPRDQQEDTGCWDQDPGWRHYFVEDVARDEENVPNIDEPGDD